MRNLRSALIWRGVLAVIIGVVAVAWPGITIGAFVILFAGYAFLAAISDLALAFRADRAGPVLGYILLAVLYAAAGIYALASPAITALVLTMFVAAWALITGITEVVIAFRRGETAGERAMWALGGLVSIALAIALLLRPDLGALSLATVFGLFSLIYGATMLATAAQVKTVAAAAARVSSAT
jgi:uncharacterized membrane protein HdeD (DUF308 family)